MKILTAIARGLPIVTKEWLYRCLDESADPVEFRHPLYAKHTIGKPLQLLVGLRVSLGALSKPVAAPIESLVRDLGGKVARSLAAADLVLVGDEEGSTHTENRLSRGNGAREGKVVPVRRFFDSIEAGQWSDESPVAKKPTATRKASDSGSDKCPGRAEATPKRSSRLEFSESSPCW